MVDIEGVEGGMEKVALFVMEGYWGIESIYRFVLFVNKGKAIVLWVPGIVGV